MAWCAPALLVCWLTFCKRSSFCPSFFLRLDNATSYRVNAFLFFPLCFSPRLDMLLRIATVICGLFFSLNYPSLIVAVFRICSWTMQADQVEADVGQAEAGHLRDDPENVSHREELTACCCIYVCMFRLKFRFRNEKPTRNRRETVVHLVCSVRPTAVLRPSQSVFFERNIKKSKT